MPKVTNRSVCSEQKDHYVASFATSKRRIRGRLILGITGGIASGKTRVIQTLAKCGVPILSSDEIAHASIRRGKPAYQAVLRAFGGTILDAKGEIDRKTLGQVVFSDLGARRCLEKIIHPYVIRAIRKFIQGRRGIIALDIPLLYEAGWVALVDVAVVVYTTKAEQIRRLQRRNGLSRQEVLARLTAQWPNHDKLRLADVVLRNTGSPAQLRQQVKKLLQDITDSELGRCTKDRVVCGRERRRASC